MEDKLCPEFEPDKYIERLIDLGRSDPVAYGTLPPAVRKIVEEYEVEKEAAQRINEESNLMRAVHADTFDFRNSKSTP